MEKMKKNVLGGPYKAKMELFPDGVSFQSFSSSSCWTI